jgi:hypothetical protein
MKKNKTHSTSRTNVTTLEKQHRMILQDRWSDAINISYNQHVEIFYRDTQLQKSEPLITTSCYDLFTIFLVTNPGSHSITEDLITGLKPGNIYFFLLVLSSPGSRLSIKGMGIFAGLRQIFLSRKAVNPISSTILYSIQHQMFV